MKATRLLPILAGIALSSPLHGAISALDIDFRDAAWANVSDSNPYTVGDITLTAQNFVPPLPFVGYVSSSLSYSAATGIGIKTTVFDPNPDEVGPLEILTVTIDPTQALTGFWVANFFKEEGSSRHPNTEAGFYNIDGDPLGTVSFDAYGSNSEGELYVDFGGVKDIGEIRFASDGKKSEFSLVGFTADRKQDIPGGKVPDGGTTVAMFGMSLLGLGLAKRLKK